MNKTLLPKLRFPEFQNSGEWRIEELGIICDVLQGYGFPEILQGKTNGRYPFYKVSDISRAVAEQGGLLKKASNYIDDNELKQIRATPIPAGSTVFAKIGEALRLNRRAITSVECLIDNNVAGLFPKDGLSDNLFIFQLSQLIDLNKYCGGAVPSVNKSTLESIRVSFPFLPEQQKIADCLISLDDLIAAQSQKVAALQAYKKGLMQNLFPAEGESAPRLRFPEFESAGEWEVKTLGEVISLEYGSPLPENSRKGGAIPVIGSNGIVGYHDEYIVSGPAIIVGRKGSAGQITWIDSNCYPIDTTFYVQNKNLNDYSMPFLKLALEKCGLERLIDNAAVPGLNRNQVYSLEAPFPKMKEQQRIAELLSVVDEEISAQGEALAALKVHKRGLMQGLFPKQASEVLETSEV